MLNFQKEPPQLASQLGGDKSDGDIKSSADSAVPAGNTNEYLKVSDKKGRLRQSTYFLAVLFFAGILGLLFMIKKSTPAPAGAAQVDASQVEQVQIEQAITKITGIRSQMFSNLEKIVKKFYEFSSFDQVDVGELARNPFKVDSCSASIEPDDAQSKFALTQGELELLSIMATERGYCCMINDKLLYEGGIINGLKVVEITGDGVTLDNGNTQMTLKLSDEY